MSNLHAWQEWSRGDYRVTTDPRALDLDAVHTFLTTTSWATGLSRAALASAIAHSLCFSLFRGQSQIGFSRIITDYVTYAYVCDVYVAEPYRAQGLGRWMMLCVFDHAVIGKLKRIALLTYNAEAFYRKLGFSPAKRGGIYLERLRSSEKNTDRHSAESQ